MKFYKKIVLALAFCLLACSCSLTKDDLEDATIYTTVYPINFLTNYLYNGYGTISSIYPLDCDLSTYELTDKQISNYAKGDLFIYNGLTNEDEIAKLLVNENNDLIIIDVSYGLSENLLNNAPEELWLSPKYFERFGKNIKENLQENLKSKIIIEQIDTNYKDFQEKISLMDATLHSLGKKAQEDGTNIIVTSGDMFKYLSNYGFEIISLEDEANLKENKLSAIQSNFKAEKYKYLLVADVHEDNEIIKELTTTYKAKALTVDSMTMTLTGDYFDIMNKYIENIKTIVS